MSLLTSRFIDSRGGIVNSQFRSFLLFFVSWPPSLFSARFTHQHVGQRFLFAPKIGSPQSMHFLAGFIASPPRR